MPARLVCAFCNREPGCSQAVACLGQLVEACPLCAALLGVGGLVKLCNPPGEAELELFEAEGGFAFEEVVDAIGCQFAGNAHHLFEALRHREIFGRFRPGPDRAFRLGLSRPCSDDVVVMLMG